MAQAAARFTPTITGSAYYVSPSGSDSNAGSLAAPFQTLTKAHSMISAGGVVYMRGGTYNIGTGSFAITKSGTSYTKMINFLAYPGETPVIDGTGSTLITTGDALFQLYGDFIYVQGIEVKNSRGMGIFLRGHHNVLADAYSHHHQTNGVLIGGDYGIVEFSRVYRTCLQNELGVHGSWASALSAARDPAGDAVTDNAIIRSCTVWENWGEGISSYEATNTIIEDNTIHDNYSANLYVSDTTGAIARRNHIFMDPSSYVYGAVGGGSNVGIMMGDETYAPASQNNKIVSNLVYGCRRNFFWFYGSSGGSLIDTIIAGNTFINSTTLWNVQINAASGAAHSNSVFRNNIVVQDDSLPVGFFGGDAGITYDHNLWSKTAPTAAQGTGDVTGDPLLLKTGKAIQDPRVSSYYRLQATSPAISAGVTQDESALDFYRELRDSSPDIGAAEYIASNPQPSPACTDGITTTAALLLKIAERLRPVYYGTATSGSTTTLVDTDRSESDDFFKGGTIFFLSGDLAGKTAVVTDYDSLSSTLTFATQGADIVAGVEYAVIDKKYRRQALVAALNLALSELGPYTQIDESLTTVKDQERYTLPAGVYNILRVTFATLESSPYHWGDPFRYWRERGGYLYFDDAHLPGTEDRKIRLYYEAPHSRVSADCDPVTDDTNPEVIALLAAIHAARVRAGIAGTSDPEPNTVIQMLTPMYQALSRQHPTRKMQRDSRWPDAVSRLKY